MLPNVGVPVVAQGGGPGGSDVLVIDEQSAPIANALFSVQPDFTNNQHDTGFIAEQNTQFQLTYAGIELVRVFSAHRKMTTSESMTIWATTFGHWKPEPPERNLQAAKVQIDDRAPIVVENALQMRLINSGGDDRFIATPNRLPGAGPEPYIVEGNPIASRDILEIRGTGFGDTVVVTDIAVTLGVPIRYTTLATRMASLVLSTGEGDDLVRIDASPALPNNLGPVTTPVFFDGGSGSDILRIEGTGATGVDETIYSPVHRLPRAVCVMKTPATIN